MILLDLIGLIHPETNICIWDDKNNVVENAEGPAAVSDGLLDSEVAEITSGYFKIDIVLKEIEA